MIHYNKQKSFWMWSISIPDLFPYSLTHIIGDITPLRHGTAASCLHNVPYIQNYNSKTIVILYM